MAVNTQNILKATDLTQSFVNIHLLSNIAKTGIAGFTFAAVIDTSYSVGAGSTDNYVQEGYSIQDNMFLKPRVIKIKGYVSETETRTPFIKALTTSAKVVGAISTFLPVLTNSSKSIIRRLKTISRSRNATNLTTAKIESGFDIYNTLISVAKFATNQQRTMAFFEALRDSRTVLSIATQFGFLPQCIIDGDIVATVSNQGTKWCEIEVSFKEWRVAERKTTTLSVQPKTSAVGIKTMVMPERKLGKFSGKKENVSVLYAIGDKLKNPLSNLFT